MKRMKSKTKKMIKKTLNISDIMKNIMLSIGLFLSVTTYSFCQEYESTGSNYGFSPLRYYKVRIEKVSKTLYNLKMKSKDDDVILGKLEVNKTFLDKDTLKEFNTKIELRKVEICKATIYDDELKGFSRVVSLGWYREPDCPLGEDLGCFKLELTVWDEFDYSAKDRFLFKQIGGFNSDDEGNNVKSSPNKNQKSPVDKKKNEKEYNPADDDSTM